ncbi:MAG: hypothetical protein OEZ22_15150, partial [Spirochaetia bacterium]|nr:hypothetical protein [Spirochaetia bacterium]
KKYLCLAGGVALNCVANGKILKENIFEDIFIQPAAGDSGGALGAALCVWYRVLQNKRSVKNKKDIMKGAFLGPVFSDKEIEQYLKEQKAVYQKLNISQVPALAAKLIHENKTVGWFQGKMEFGLRALGARSILANAKDEKMHFILNMKIKNRENFRPFAPAVLAEDAAKYFDLKQISPYMLLTASVKKTRLKKTKKENALKAGFDMLKVIRSDIPSVTHVDNSARIQTVHKETNPVFYNLLTALKKNYGYSVVINTSFNAKDEPIVCGPDDAYKCFQNTGLDYLIMGSYLIKKQEI